MKKLAKPEPTSAYINRTSREYSLYVLDHRAIPSLTDGLKSSQRIALHLARTLSSHMRTSAFAGRMIESELYVHGNVSAEDTISNLAAPYTNNRPLLRGEGAFGTRSAPNQRSAARYTNIMRAKFAEEVLYVDHELVPEMENYDGSKLMPASFLPLVPLLLLNGVSGIAIGWSTRILPRSFADIRAATLEYLQTGEVKNRLTPKYEGYSVKIVKGDAEGKYVVSGKFERLSETKVRITEIPLESHNGVITLESYREFLDSLELKELIVDFIDRSKDRIDIEVIFPGPISDDQVLARLKLSHILTERIVVLGPPDSPGVRQYQSAQDVVRDFVNWRLGWYKVRYERLARLERDEELFQLSMAAVYEDEVPGRISSFDDKTEFKSAINAAIFKAKLEVRDDIVERLSMLPGYRWTKEGYNEAKALAIQADKKAKEYADISKSPAKQRKIYQSELESIRG